MGADHIAQADGFTVFGFFAKGLESGRFLQLHAHIEAQQAQRPGDQKGNAPAPCQHGLRPQRHLQAGDQRGTGDIAAKGAELQPAAHQATAAVGGIFGHEGRRAAIFAAGRKALHQTGAQQQRRGGHADLRIGGDQADGKGADGHHHHGHGQHLVAAIAVPQGPQHDAAQRAHEESGGEGGERGDQLHGGFVAREENLPQRDRQIAVNAKVEPLHRIAERGRGDGAVEGGTVNDGDVADGDFVAAFEPAEMRVQGVTPGCAQRMDLGCAQRMDFGHVCLRCRRKRAR